jgi:hypothetical protein
MGDAAIEPTEGKLLCITRFRQLLLDIDKVPFSPELGARVIEIRCTLAAGSPRRAFIVEPRFLNRVSLFLSRLRHICGRRTRKDQRKGPLINKTEVYCCRNRAEILAYGIF